MPLSWFFLLDRDLLVISPEEPRSSANAFSIILLIDIFDDNFEYKKYIKLKNDYLSSKKQNTLFYTHNSYPGHSQN